MSPVWQTKVLCPLKVHTEAVTPRWWYWRWGLQDVLKSGYEAGVPVMGFRVFIRRREVREHSPPVSLPLITWEPNEKAAIYKSGKEPSPRIDFAATLILHFLASQAMRNRHLLLKSRGLLQPLGQSRTHHTCLKACLYPGLQDVSPLCTQQHFPLLFWELPGGLSSAHSLFTFCPPRGGSSHLPAPPMPPTRTPHPKPQRRHPHIIPRSTEPELVSPFPSPCAAATRGGSCPPARSDPATLWSPPRVWPATE